MSYVDVESSHLLFKAFINYSKSIFLVFLLLKNNSYCFWS